MLQGLCATHVLSGIPSTGSAKLSSYGSSPCVTFDYLLICGFLISANIFIPIHYGSSKCHPIVTPLLWFDYWLFYLFRSFTNLERSQAWFGYCYSTKTPRITRAILIAIHHSLDMNLPSHAMTRALFTVAFLHFYSSPTWFRRPLQPLIANATRRDIKFTTSGCFLRIKWSKTSQHKEEIHVVPLPMQHSTFSSLASHRHLPLLQLGAYQSRRSFLQFPYCHQSVTASFFPTALIRLISKLDLTPANYSPHSFRLGGRKFAFQAGAPEHLLQLHWSRTTYRPIPHRTRSTLADIMAAGLYRPNRWF